MSRADLIRWGYRLATTLILGGFAMLCQPVWEVLFGWGFQVLLVGVILFVVLDHVPEPVPEKQE